MTPARAPDPVPHSHAPDPGRQPERTRLAWRRTALAMTVVTGLTVRLALTAGAAGVVPAAVTVAAWAGLMFLLRPWRAAAPTPGWALPLSALATVGAAGLGAVLVLAALG